MLINSDFEAPPVEECELARAIEAVGDRWTLLILREALCGVQRFDQMHRDLHIPRSVLAARLSALVDLNVLRPVPYQEAGMRRRNGYLLTEAGKALIPALLGLREWAQTYMPNSKSHLRLVTNDGDPVLVRMVTEREFAVVGPEDVKLRVDR